MFSLAFQTMLERILKIRKMLNHRKILIQPYKLILLLKFEIYFSSVKVTFVKTNYARMNFELVITLLNCYNLKKRVKIERRNERECFPKIVFFLKELGLYNIKYCTNNTPNAPNGFMHNFYKIKFCRIFL